MRALALLLCPLVLIATAAIARADGARVERATMLNAPPPAPARDVVAVTRVESFAVRALQPRLTLSSSSVVRAVKLTPMFPLGAYLTVEYALGKR